MALSGSSSAAGLGLGCLRERHSQNTRDENVAIAVKAWSPKRLIKMPLHELATTPLMATSVNSMETCASEKPH